MADANPVRRRASLNPALRRLLGRIALVAAMTAGLGFLLLALAGVFHPKVLTDPAPPVPDSMAGLATAEVRLVRRPRYETAVGTVRAVHEAAVASRLLAKVVEVKVQAGQSVTRDEVLIRLDDSDLQSRLKQADAVLTAARSGHEKAKADLDRARQLIETRTISQAEYDQAVAAFKSTTAELSRATEALDEAKVILDYATIRAPITGVVIDKRVESGETVGPGHVLLNLYDPTRMQMVVSARESLAQRLRVGQKVPGRLEGLDYECEAVISEIVPEAQTASRSFTVKVTGPCPPGVYSGMFGRIYIPLEEEVVLVVPATAVSKVGQLEMVDVALESGLRRRSVQLGRRLGDDYEVLSGLSAGEKVVVSRAEGESR
jgi:RND family efflux transporter MFP subunit